MCWKSNLKKKIHKKLQNNWWTTHTWTQSQQGTCEDRFIEFILGNHTDTQAHTNTHTHTVIIRSDIKRLCLSGRLEEPSVYHVDGSGLSINFTHFCAHTSTFDPDTECEMQTGEKDNQSTQEITISIAKKRRKKTLLLNLPFQVSSDCISAVSWNTLALSDKKHLQKALSHTTVASK